MQSFWDFIRAEPWKLIKENSDFIRTYFFCVKYSIFRAALTF
jgi:hypothetical protein